MKTKVSFLIFSLMCIINKSNAQWSLQTSLSTYYNFGFGYIADVTFTSADTGIYTFYKMITPSTGYDSFIMTTVNAGITWSIGMHKIDHMVYDRCNNVRGKNIYYVTIGGGAQTVKSIDGGLTWTLVNGSIWTTKGFSAPDSNVWFTLAFDMIYKSNNTVWIGPIDTFPPNTVYGLFFTDTINGYIISTDSISSYKGQVLKSSQGGINWSSVYSDSSKNFNCLVFPSMNTGYIAGNNGKIIKTSNSGNIWTDVNTTLPDKINCIDFFNDSVGVIGGDSGFIMTTINGGASWSIENTGFLWNVVKIFCLNDSIIYAATVNSFTQEYKIYKRILNAPGGNMEINNKCNQLHILPNPTTGKNNIIVPDDFLTAKNLTLSIYDNAGKLIQQKILEMNESIIKLNLEAEAKGVYNVILGNKKKSYNGKIVFE